MITGFESEARAHLKEVENVFNRKEFTKNAETYVAQMIRAGLRRYEEQRDCLVHVWILLPERSLLGRSSSEKQSRVEKSARIFPSGAAYDH